MSGLFEILLLAAVVLLLFGGRQLPAVGAAIGKMVGAFRRQAKSRDDIDVKRIGPTDGQTQPSERCRR